MTLAWRFEHGLDPSGYARLGRAERGRVDTWLREHGVNPRRTRAIQVGPDGTVDAVVLRLRDGRPYTVGSIVAVDVRSITPTRPLFPLRPGP